MECILEQKSRHLKSGLRLKNFLQKQVYCYSAGII